MSSYLSVFYFDVCAFPPEIWDYLHRRKTYIDRVNLEFWVFVGLAVSSYIQSFVEYVLVIADDRNEKRITLMDHTLYNDFFIIDYKQKYI